MGACACATSSTNKKKLQIQPVYLDDPVIRVPLRKELKHKLIFGLEARLPIAEVLSFLGYEDEVLPVLQQLSHGTRAYVWNAGGLKGFLVVSAIQGVLRKAFLSGEIQKVTEFQEVNVQALIL